MYLKVLGVTITDKLSISDHVRDVTCKCAQQWRNNRACSARGPSAVGAQNLPDAVFKKSFLGEEGALLEYLHAGPLQPCYATGAQTLHVIRVLHV